MEVKLIMGG